MPRPRLGYVNTTQRFKVTVIQGDTIPELYNGMGFNIFSEAEDRQEIDQHIAVVNGDVPRLTVTCRSDYEKYSKMKLFAYYVQIEVDEPTW